MKVSVPFVKKYHTASPRKRFRKPPLKIRNHPFQTKPPDRAALAVTSLCIESRRPQYGLATTITASTSHR